MKILLPVLFLFISIKAICQQTDMQKFLKDAKAKANAFKKTNPNAKSQTGLPAGYDNSWRLKVSLTRTVIGTTNLTAKNGCKETKKGTLNYIMQANFSSDQTIGWLNGDDFQLATDMDENLKPYMRPLKGSYNINCSSTVATTNCDESGNSEFTGGANIDPSGVKLSFSFNTKSRKGDFQVALPDEYTINASGKATSRSKGNPPITVDIADLGKAQIGLLTASCGIFQSWNYPVAKDAATEQALVSSPVNGGQASIGKTKYGYEVSYSESKTISKVPDGWTGTDELTYTTNVQISLFDKDPIEYDAIIEPFAVANASGNYEKWIPEGPKIGSNNQLLTSKGNSISFKIYIVDKKHPDQPLPGIQYTVMCSLIKGSKEPGYCNNLPVRDGNQKWDLRFDSIMKAMTNVASYSETEVKSVELKGSDVMPIITSYDYGSFAKLKVDVTLEYGTHLNAHFKNDAQTEIPIPMDKNDNQIADEWEIENGVTGLSDGWDEETSPENNNNGDGLTLYEEYRGIVAKGKYIRLDPHKKELFVLNHLGDQAQAGFDLFSKATGIKVIELTDNDVDQYDRIVNVNSVFARLGKQHALLMKDYRSSNNATQGYTPNLGGTDAPPVSPADCQFVGINLGYQYKGNDLAVTIAHEMAHGCGVWHHGGLESLDPPDKKDIDSSYQFYAGDMSPAATESIEGLKKQGLLGLIAGPGGQSSGDMYCIMCYDDQYVWAAPKGSEGKIYINIDHADECSKTRFCDSNKGTYLNDPHHKPYSVYGNASKGDCIHQFKVKDW
jgi:hypothetical protein